MKTTPEYFDGGDRPEWNIDAYTPENFLLHNVQLTASKKHFNYSVKGLPDVNKSHCSLEHWRKNAVELSIIEQVNSVKTNQSLVQSKDIHVLFRKSTKNSGTSYTDILLLWSIFT